MKKIIPLFFVLFLSSCALDNMLYKYGNGIKGIIDGATTGIACVATGGTVCAVGLGVKGYIDGKQDARTNIESKETRQRLNRVFDKTNNTECGFLDKIFNSDC